jgi:hypothetical protein
MVIYNVTTHVEPSVQEDWLLWMRQELIPQQQGNNTKGASQGKQGNQKRIRTKNSQKEPPN